MPDQDVVAHLDVSAGEHDDAELRGDAEHDAADDVPDADLGRTSAVGFDGQEDVLGGQGQGGNGGPEKRPLDGEVVQDALMP